VDINRRFKDASTMFSLPDMGKCGKSFMNHESKAWLGGEPGGGSKLVKLMAPQNKVSLRST
jgi:hypothetical protein